MNKDNVCAPSQTWFCFITVVKLLYRYIKLIKIDFYFSEEVFLWPTCLSFTVPVVEHSVFEWHIHICHAFFYLKSLDEDSAPLVFILSTTCGVWLMLVTSWWKWDLSFTTTNRQGAGCTAGHKWSSVQHQVTVNNMKRVSTFKIAVMYYFRFCVRMNWQKHLKHTDCYVWSLLTV